MNVATWMLIGGFLGWVGCSFLELNTARGALVSTIIGAAGGVLGGELLAPLFTGLDKAPGDFSSSAMVFAASVSAAVLVVVNLTQKRPRA